MHTATSLNAGMFAIRIAGRDVDRHALLEWQLHDRMGVVLTEPLGIVGASMLIQLAITAYFDARAERRTTPHYAEIYAFHVGRPRGDCSHFDLAPSRKEVFLDDSDSLLGAINAHAITHLVVPDHPNRPISHVYKEPEIAHDRLRRCYAYSPSGVTLNPDVTIRGMQPAMLGEVDNTLDAEKVLAAIPQWLSVGSPETRADTALWAERFRKRIDEVSDVDRAARRRQRMAINVNGLPTESYRRISIDQALGMLYTQDSDLRTLS